MDKLTGEPVKDANGKPVIVSYKKGDVIGFKTSSVFDVAQTEGEPIKELELFKVNELTGDVENFGNIMNGLRELSPVKIDYTNIESGAKGYYDNLNKEIYLQKDMSELQTLKTAIHEVAHAKLHDIDLKNLSKLSAEEKQKQGTIQSREIEAESVAFTVCDHYGLDTSDYSFKYVAGWSSGKEAPELKKSMDLIRNAAHEIISSLDTILELVENKEVVKEKPLKISLTDITKALEGISKNIVKADPAKTTGQAAFCVAQKRLSSLTEKLPDNDNGFRQLITTAIESNTLEEMKISMKAIDNAILEERKVAEKYDQITESRETTTPDGFITGEIIETPRGYFSLTDMTMAQMKEAGYGFHHSSDDGQYLIMGNGTQAFAIANEDSHIATVEIDTEENYNNIDGVRNNIKPATTRRSSPEAYPAEREKDESKGKPSLAQSLKECKEKAAQQDKAEHGAEPPKRKDTDLER